MRTWNTPAINELDVRLTASSGIPSNGENGGYNTGNGWASSTYNSSVYEHTGTCVIPVKAGGQS